MGDAHNGSARDAPATVRAGRLHVLTVHFNTPALTSNLLRTFPAATPRGREVLIHVLDNCSTPGNLEALRLGLDGMAGVTLIANEENIGFGAGLNLLAANGAIDGEDILWFLNPDTRLEPGCLGSLEAEIDQGNFTVVSPLIFSGEGESAWVWYCGGYVDGRNLRPQHASYGCRLTEIPELTRETEFVTGAAPMMRASTFRAVCGFARDYFLYWEDAQLSWKLREKGHRLGVVPAARLWHAVGASSGSGQSHTFYYWFARNRFTFARDTGVPKRRLLLGPGGVETLRIVAKAMVERHSRWSKTSAAIRGTMAGIRRKDH